jgi:hypothetical protein
VICWILGRASKRPTRGSGKTPCIIRCTTTSTPTASRYSSACRATIHRSRSESTRQLPNQPIIELPTLTISTKRAAPRESPQKQGRNGSPDSKALRMTVLTRILKENSQKVENLMNSREARIKPCQQRFMITCKYFKFKRLSISCIIRN